MGWPYTSILRQIIDAPLSNKNRDAAYEWVKKIPPAYVSSYSGYSNSSQGKDPKALMVAINAQEMTTGGKKNPLFPMVMNNFGQALLNYIQEKKELEGIRYDQVRSLQNFVPVI